MRTLSCRQFRRPNGGTVLIGAVAEELLNAHRQDRPGLAESGGVLLGRLIVESEDIVIDEATGPQRADRATRYRFFRAKSPTQRLVDRAWALSQGTRNYLGEWHSHPEDHPLPSGVDRENWVELGQKVVRTQPTLFFAIVGRKETKLWELVPTAPPTDRRASTKWRLEELESL